MKSTNDEGRVVWVAHIGPGGRVYSYLHLTGRFHHNAGLHHDYYFDQDEAYQKISASEAVELINVGTGMHNANNIEIAQRIAQSEWSMSAEEVLGEAAADIIND